jgi:nucleotide-binding universal stress UspA family protein
MFQKILVPLDGSKIAAKILPNVTAIAQTMKAQVTLLHVCASDVGEQIGEAAPGVMMEAAAQEAKFCQTFLAQTCKDLEEQGLKVNWACADGVPAREIIAYAQNNHYDLIVLGTHGRGEVAWNLGGVADKVAKNATIPVLLFRTLEIPPPLLKEKLAKLMRQAELYLGW